jgi:superfamily II DNA or RNA helicase
MVQLVINNSYSKITGLSAVQEKELREALSYVVGGNSAYFSGYGPRKKSLLSKKGEFPTGLLLRVINYIKIYNYELVDLRATPDRRPPKSLKTKVIPYPDQSKAVDIAIRCRRGIISMPTGTGKSMVIALLAARLNVLTLVVVPSLEIKKQLTMSLLEVLGDDHKIDVENIDSVSLEKFKHYDCLIIDEAHHSAAKTYQKLNKTAWSNIYYRFFLTATPFRNDNEETLLFESIAGRIIYQLTYKEAISKEYIVPVEAYYIEMPKQSTDAYTWAEVYNKLVVNNDIRNETIANLLNSLHENGVYTLCLVKEIKHGKILSDMSGAPFVSGEDDESRNFIKQFNKGNIKVLIGTVGILGEGVDTKPCEYVIICGLGKAKSQFMQQVGRAVRIYPGKESGKVILVRDTSHRFCLRHFNQQVKILKKEYGAMPLKIEL